MGLSHATIVVLALVTIWAMPAGAQTLTTPPARSQPAPHEDPMCELLRDGANRDAGIGARRVESDVAPDEDEPLVESAAERQERRRRQLAEYGCTQ
ncbi:hypothetical protein [Methylobacterium sp. JK268]